jgi:hypothetical protein
MGYGCKCGQRFPTKKIADAHAADQNLIEQNEAKAKQAAKAAEAEAAELAHQAHEATEPAMEPEAPAQSPIPTEPPTEKKPGDSESKRLFGSEHGWRLDSHRRVNQGLKVSGPSGSEATKHSDRRPRRCLTLCVVRVRVGAPGPMPFSMFPTCMSSMLRSTTSSG